MQGVLTSTPLALARNKGRDKKKGFRVKFPHVIVDVDASQLPGLCKQLPGEENDVSVGGVCGLVGVVGASTDGEDEGVDDGTTVVIGDSRRGKDDPATSWPLPAAGSAADTTPNTRRQQ